MKFEYITIKETETAVKIQNTHIDAVRTKDITKTGVRAVKDGKIGISGAMGATPIEQLEKEAIENLAVGISYDYALSSNRVDHRNFMAPSGPMQPSEMIKNADHVLGLLKNEFPEFDFSEKIATQTVEMRYKNTEGLDLAYFDSFFELGLILKEKSSSNLFDGFIQYAGRHFDVDQFWTFNRHYLNAYRTKLDLPQAEKMPVFFVGTDNVSGFLMRQLNGERFATKSSLFSDKLNTDLFDRRITLGQCANSKVTYQPFFDKEGCILKDDFYPLIERGKLTSVFTDKKTAKQYNLPHTGAASGLYDGMPRIGQTHLSFKTDSYNLTDALKGEMAILVVVAAGGDFTPDGTYASPVQVSFLFDGEKIIGKLPEFTIRSTIWDMLGKDYIGTFECPFYMVEGAQLQGYSMQITA